MANGGSSRIKANVLLLNIRKNKMAEAAKDSTDVAQGAASDESLISHSSSSKDLHMTNALVRSDFLGLHNSNHLSEEKRRPEIWK